MVVKKTTAKKTTTKSSTTKKTVAKKTMTAKKTSTVKKTVVKPTIKSVTLKSDNIKFQTYDYNHTAFVNGFYAYLSDAYKATTIVFPKSVSRYGKQYRVCYIGIGGYSDLLQCRNLKSVKVPKSLDKDSYTPTVPFGVKVLHY